MSWVDIDLALRKIEGQQVRLLQQITFGGNSHSKYFTRLPMK